MGGRDGIGGGVPVASRKVVMSLKEVVNRSDLEIYAMLVECNMDPDEAVNRLLSQDTFHEVKSKREKKKETKDSSDSWSQGVGNRGARNGSDYYAGRGGGNNYNSNETGSLQGKPTNRRENGTHNHLAGSSTTSGVLGRQPPSNSYPNNAEIKKVSMSSSDVVSSSSVSSSRYQSPWGAMPGQRTMADIVKMGRPLTQNTKLPHSSETLVSTKEIGTRVPSKDDFPSIEKPDITKVSAEPTMHTGPYSESSVRTDQLPEDPVTEDHPVAYSVADQVWSASVSSQNLHNDESGDSLLCEDDNNKNAESYQVQRHPIERDETKDPSASVVTSFQKLSVDNDEESNEPVVIIPNHLQVHTPECLHLMFGSFGPGMGSGQPSGLTSGSFNEESPEVADDSMLRHPDTRDAEFYGEEEHLRNASNEQISYQIDSNAQNYHSSSDGETEPTQHDNPEPVQENQYKFSSTADYTYESSQQLNPTLPPSNTSPQMQSFNTLPNVMDVREQDLQYLPFPYNQSMPTKHTTTASSLGGPAISMAEALRAASISGQSNQQAMPDAGQAALAQQHLPMNPYSQHTLPLGHYANMISYPFMPQSYPYMPSAFQQTYPSNNTYHQSLAAMLPQYKTSNRPQSATAPSPYSFSSSGGNSGIGYEDLLSSQFKDNNHLTSYQQQTESPSMWPPQGPNNSRVPSANAYYSFPGHQSQQPPGFRHSQQQPSQQEQHFEGHGYVSPYHSTLDHQNARDAPKQSQQQLWQNNY